MKKWQILAPLGLAAAGAAVFLLRRSSAKPASASKTAPERQSAPAKTPAKQNTGSYSFISGFRDAATVEMQISYDPEKFSYAVVEEGFLSDTSDSHVALVEGEDFSLQLEYASYYAGEDFEAFLSHLAEKHRDMTAVRYGSVDGVKYLAGDNICFCIPIPEDAFSYLLVTLFKAKDNDTELSELPDDPQVAALLESIRFTRS